VWRFESQDFGPEGRTELTIFLDTVRPDGLLRRRILSVIRHYVTPEQTQAELREAGFQKIELHGGFKREPFLDHALRGRGRQIFLATKQKED
jgi:hypothetical protein